MCGVALAGLEECVAGRPDEPMMIGRDRARFERAP